MKKAAIIADIEQTLAEKLPDVEVVDVDVAGGGGKSLLRVFIDHPDGVGHGLCVEVTGYLSRYLTDHTVEVSSPGLERRLRTPEHFQAAAGKKINVKTFGPVQGQRNFTGFLVSSDRDKLIMKLDDREAEIPLDMVAKANTIFEFDQQAKRGRSTRKKGGRRRGK